MAEASPPVTLERLEGGVALIRLNRPEKKNAIHLPMAQGLQRHLRAIEADGEVRAAVLTGHAGCFCAGMDVQAFAAGELPIVEPEGFAGIVRAQRRKPLIAAVDGIALGGGFEIALACDLIFASREARFAFPEAGRGLVAAQGGCARLPARISPYIALDWLLTGRLVSAEEAHRSGAISRLCQGSALDEALAAAREIAAKPSWAIEAAKAIVSGECDLRDAPAFSRQEPWVQSARSQAREALARS
ncbi:enoyl-CoA hydratase-related protein [Chromobacterium sp. IIBBL 290-4]|uniref:enoyl-CoA hydratase-related protein n=1 Tax=Chromobacterium sp. IIBBL 290-4 TaxID=2953890 RepID=UPI0020B8FA27|nr:enoyl-CoA hydratase-related protein [Chromobacterium sp. IIBBL 290-4]UTH75724.1 enoyl-CoA hydratase-related protein [Chromobacterium sp. IIBBL 290-4]